MIDYKKFLNKKVIIRGRYSGVQWGVLKEVDGEKVILNNARRLWYWSGAASLTELSQSGVAYPGRCKFTVISKTSILINDAIEIIICTEKANKIISEVPEWKIN